MFVVVMLDLESGQSATYHRWFNTMERELAIALAARLNKRPDTKAWVARLKCQRVT